MHLNDRCAECGDIEKYNGILSWDYITIHVLQYYMICDYLIAERDGTAGPTDRPATERATDADPGEGVHNPSAQTTDSRASWQTEGCRGTRGKGDNSRLSFRIYRDLQV